VAKARRWRVSLTRLAPPANRTQVQEFGGRHVVFVRRAVSIDVGNDHGGSVNGTIGYQYDPVGNRLQRTSTVYRSSRKLSYDANDRLTTTPTNPDGTQPPLAHYLHLRLEII